MNMFSCGINISQIIMKSNKYFSQIQEVPGSGKNTDLTFYFTSYLLGILMVVIMACYLQQRTDKQNETCTESMHTYLSHTETRLKNWSISSCVCPTGK
jgi:hypothetical protein